MLGHVTIVVPFFLRFLLLEAIGAKFSCGRQYVKTLVWIYVETSHPTD